MPIGRQLIFSTVLQPSFFSCCFGFTSDFDLWSRLRPGHTWDLHRGELVGTVGREALGLKVFGKSKRCKFLVVWF